MGLRNEHETLFSRVALHRVRVISFSDPHRLLLELPTLASEYEKFLLARARARALARLTHARSCSLPYALAPSRDRASERTEPVTEGEQCGEEKRMHAKIQFSLPPCLTPCLLEDRPFGIRPPPPPRPFCLKLGRAEPPRSSWTHEDFETHAPSVPRGEG